MSDIARNIGTGSVGAQARARPATKETWSDDAGFYLAMILVSSALIFAGFAPSFYLKSVINAPPPLTALTMTHGVVFTAWMLVVIAQATFIAMKKPAPHRQLGILGVLLFGAMISLGLSTAITAARLGNAPPGAPEQPYFFALPAIGLLALLIVVAAALWLRRRSDWHKRLMIAAFIMMTQPGVGRLAIPAGFAEQGVTIGFFVMEILLASAIGYDLLKYRRVHPAYWASAAIFAIFHASVVWAFGSPVWLAFANAITEG